MNKILIKDHCFIVTNTGLLVLLFFCCSSIAFGDNYSEAMKAREQALQGLKGFNPGATIKDYSANPQEQHLASGESSNNLSEQGLNALQNSASAKEIYQQAQTRPKVRPSPNSPELRYAESLLENPDEVLNGRCYKQPASCETKQETKNCIETVSYKPLQCLSRLSVELKPLQYQLRRSFYVRKGSRIVTIELAQCQSQDSSCTAFIPSPNCEAIQASVSRGGQALNLAKAPTCAEPTINVQLSHSKHPITLEVNLIQWVSKDSWLNQSCENEKTLSSGQCLLNEAVSCSEPNATKLIQGFPITRPCWGKGLSYLCRETNTSDCEVFLNQSCSQVSSHCAEEANGHCLRFEQGFACQRQFCTPEKTICPEKMACTEGECDNSSNEVSDDIQEGIARLGALAGVASEVSSNQVQSQTPAIFKGSNARCRIAVAGIGNCCHGKAHLLNCRDEEKDLSKAKAEGRAAKVGKYCAHEELGICLEEKESWCVFPTKLSAIIQIQGRLKQLGIDFGRAFDKHNEPNCRGISPEELERINFSALDLSPIEKELVARMALPSNQTININSQARVNQWQQERRAHE